MNEELLNILQEEAAEVIQAVSKIKRFGWESTYAGPTNRAHLTEELGDLLCMIQLLIKNKLIDPIELQHYADLKEGKLKKWSKIFQENHEYFEP